VGRPQLWLRLGLCPWLRGHRFFTRKIIQTGSIVTTTIAIVIFEVVVEIIVGVVGTTRIARLLLWLCFSFLHTPFLCCLCCLCLLQKPRLFARFLLTFSLLPLFLLLQALLSLRLRSLCVEPRRGLPHKLLLPSFLLCLRVGDRLPLGGFLLEGLPKCSSVSLRLFTLCLQSLGLSLSLCANCGRVNRRRWG
jgi:hypothetical protein